MTDEKQAPQPTPDDAVNFLVDWHIKRTPDIASHAVYRALGHIAKDTLHKLDLIAFAANEWLTAEAEKRRG